jgi:hypothetical protein
MPEGPGTPGDESRKARLPAPSLTSVPRAPLAFRALTLLLAFGLGGLAVPLAHEIDHLLDGRTEVASQEVGVVGDEEEPGAHDDCTLCDVRFTAEEASAEASVPATYASPEAPELVSPLARGPTRAFSGRAPPVLI